MSECSIKEIDKPQCNCGIVGVFGHPQASVMAYYALHALQHRGQEAAGIVASRVDEVRNRRHFAFHKDNGLVLDVFSEKDILTKELRGDAAIAHNRYSTTGASQKKENIQPFYIKYSGGNLALAHNGNLTNTRALRKELQQQGAIFQSSSDSELFLHLIARSRQTGEVERILEALRTVRGAYSVVFLTDDKLVAARDPHGFRPLCIGRKQIEGKWAYFVASETCALDIISAEFVRDIKHNEVVIIDNNTIETGSIQSYTIREVTPEARHCVFEYIYFARPDSKIFGHSVDKVRRKLGKNLAEEHPVVVDDDSGDKLFVVGVPDSANTAALGFSTRNERAGGTETRFEIGLIRSHYVGRSFIAPEQNAREMKVKTKFNPVEGVINGRRIILIDDSIVRGTTSRLLIDLIREHKPKELHFRVSSPPVRFPCHYGMDFPSREELIANHYDNAEQVAEYLGTDTLQYMSVEKMIESVPCDDGVGYCAACFTGNYPVEIETGISKTDGDE